ncbi:MAG TPA: helix-turn-helix domain-containing protein [Actinospica sp.]|jgi:DNA-binding transcriptional ArsR family regulator|nr:helix-turn-helix domain-containing protein [Actinospica sp.]
MDEPTPYEDLRRLSDARELRALAHPARMALYEVLALHESLTATQASKLIGGSPSSVAYHLRTLARYGYVEETNDGTGRERPWKLRHIGFRFSDDTADPETKAAAHALSRQLFKRWLERREAYQENKERWSEQVRDAVGDWNTIIFGTAEELRELQDAIFRLTRRFHDRITDPSLRPEHWQTFEFQLYTHPIDTSEFVLSDAEEGS